MEKEEAEPDHQSRDGTYVHSLICHVVIGAGGGEQFVCSWLLQPWMVPMVVWQTVQREWNFDTLWRGYCSCHVGREERVGLLFFWGVDGGFVLRDNRHRLMWLLGI